MAIPMDIANGSGAGVGHDSWQTEQHLTRSLNVTFMPATKRRTKQVASSCWLLDVSHGVLSGRDEMSIKGIHLSLFFLTTYDWYSLSSLWSG